MFKIFYNDTIYYKFKFVESIGKNLKFCYTYNLYNLYKYYNIMYNIYK